VQIVLVLVALLAGVGLPVQAGLNAALARHAGRPEWATFVSFLVGLVGIACWIGAARVRAPTASDLAAAPLWSYTGGLLGAFYVTAVVLLTPRLGVAVTLALTLAGQMAGAILLDHAGALGLATRPITAPRLVGVALLFAGVMLIRR
jgi:transporter family-2 protein